MKVVVQRVKQSSVVVDKNVVGKIDKGLLVLVGFTEGDTINEIKWLEEKHDKYNQTTYHIKVSITWTGKIQGKYRIILA